jgi:hypothetical protein
VALMRVIVCALLIYCLSDLAASGPGGVGAPSGASVSLSIAAHLLLRAAVAVSVLRRLPRALVLSVAGGMLGALP